MNKYLYLFAALVLSALPITTQALEGDIDPNPSRGQCFQLTNNLRYQSRDSGTNGDVSTLQAFLQAKGYLNSEPTGYFGLLTLAAAKKFQAESGIESTGFVGPITRTAILKFSNCGANTTEVRVPVVSETHTTQSQPSISVFTPTFGQTYNAGDRIVVEWRSSNLSSAEQVLDVELRNINTGLDTRLDSNVKDSGKLGYFLPTNVASGNYSVVLKTSVTRDGGLISVLGQSPTFYIYNSSMPDPHTIAPTVQPSITILAPTYGQRVNAQRMLSAEWQTAGLEPSEKIMTVRLRDMSKGEEHYLASDIYNTGKASFAIPTDLPNGKYVLELKTAVTRNGSGLSVIGKSEPFSLVDSRAAQPETNNTVNVVPTNYYNNPDTNNAISTNRQDLETRISMQILDSTKPFAGAWGQFSLDSSVSSQSKKNWNWELALQPRSGVKKNVIKIVVEHEGSNQRWSTGDSFNWPLVVRQDGSTLNSSYDPLNINLSGDTKYSFRLYGDIDNRAQSGTLVTVFYSDGTYSQTKIDGRRPRLDGNDTNNDTIISRPLDPTITIVAPNSGNRIDVYNSRSINAQWRSLNLSTTLALSGVRLRNVDTGKDYLLDSGVINDGLERFKVPGDIADDTDEGHYVLEIKTEVPGRSGTIQATSEPFVITSSMPRKIPTTPVNQSVPAPTQLPSVAPASSIQFKYPNGAESWQSGINQAQEFSWTFSGDAANTKVGISIMNISTYSVIAVANGISNTNSYKWTVPAGIPTGGYKAYIWATDSRGNIIAKDDSDKDFYILGERR